MSRLNLDGSEYSVLVDSSENVGPQAIDYHLRYIQLDCLSRELTWKLHVCRLNKLFWSHYRDGSIHQATLDGSNHTILVSNVTRPSELVVVYVISKDIFTTGALAVDWINNKVYFSFGDHGSTTVNPNHLAIYDMCTGEVTEITSAVDSNAVFHDLAVDPNAQ